MTERPIIFSAPMVRAILKGQKTQTRRVQGRVQVRPDGMSAERLLAAMSLCPYGKPGDRLWVREAWGFETRTEDDPLLEPVATYRADEVEHLHPVNRWRPAIHMPRHLSRITLEVTAVRVERLQDISEADAIAEGVVEHQTLRTGTRACNLDGGMMHACGPVPVYRTLWESINGPGSWDANPWVWVVEFRRFELSHQELGLQNLNGGPLARAIEAALKERNA